MSDALTIQVPLRSGRRGERRPQQEEHLGLPQGRVPRVARLMALAIRFEGLLRNGVVRDQAELARLGHVSRARLTQIMNLLNLAPDIQEQILLLPPTTSGREPIRERHVRNVATVFDWREQRRIWARLQ